MKNQLHNQTSPYLLQHAENPVNWYPWCEEAFAIAKKEDKPIFLSIGYSTCHWCHVMAHESFEDVEIAEILNQHFVSIKVDKEERPDIDSIYMSVCQAFTGSGGWPTTLFLTPEQKPFFAGTYFPKTTQFGRIGLKELLLTVQEKWKTDRAALMQSAEGIVSALRNQNVTWDSLEESEGIREDLDPGLLDKSFQEYQSLFDEKYGGFGGAPKFPTPHNLLFLMKYYEKSKDERALEMVEKTLIQMYRGGIFDHIGGGFSRYSTDAYFLVPHFEKMLYDNALLILAYCKAFEITKKPIYKTIAEKTAEYILREMTSPEGGFYCAQDADSEGVEGKYYLFEPEEVKEILGDEKGEEFNRYFDITPKGNFEGKNIPNLLRNQDWSQRWSEMSHQNKNLFGNNENFDVKFKQELSVLYEYRKQRVALHLDDKILTSWNGLMIAAMCHLYRITGNKNYFMAAVDAHQFIQDQLCEGDSLFISYRKEQRSGKGLLDDYANEIFALLSLYGATLDADYLEKASVFADKVIDDFWDQEQGGFFLYGKENEQLIIRPKETFDGAMFSGNSAMAYNLVQLYYLTGEERFGEMAQRQLEFLSAKAENYPTRHAMFLVALSDFLDMPEKITVVVKDDQDLLELPCKISLDAVVHVLDCPTQEYLLKNDKTTFYICKEHSCLPPVNELD